MDMILSKWFQVPSQAHVYQSLIAELKTKHSRDVCASENANIDKNTTSCLDEALKIMSNQ